MSYKSNKVTNNYNLPNTTSITNRGSNTKLKWKYISILHHSYVPQNDSPNNINKISFARIKAPHVLAYNHPPTLKWNEAVPEFFRCIITMPSSSSLPTASGLVLGL